MVLTQVAGNGRWHAPQSVPTGNVQWPPGKRWQLSQRPTTKLWFAVAWAQDPPVVWHPAQLSVDAMWPAPFPVNNVLLWQLTHAAVVCECWNVIGLRKVFGGIEWHAAQLVDVDIPCRCFPPNW